MKRYIFLTAILIFFSMQVNAGSTFTVPIAIDTVLKQAMGDMSSARFSDNTVESIGCGARTSIDETTGEVTSYWGFCFARNAENELAICYTTNEALVNQISALSTYSYISFNWNDAGDCTTVRHSTQSRYIP